jgi:flagellar hook-basal body complex protein FliE
MAAPILPVSSGAVPDSIPSASPSSNSGGGFQEVFTGAIQSVETLGQNASASVQRFLSGEGEELHSTILATQRADLAFEMFMQVRNKVVSAYQEIMRMQM